MLAWLITADVQNIVQILLSSCLYREYTVLTKVGQYDGSHVIDSNKCLTMNTNNVFYSSLRVHVLAG